MNGQVNELVVGIIGAIVVLFMIVAIVSIIRQRDAASRMAVLHQEKLLKQRLRKEEHLRFEPFVRDFNERIRKHLDGMVTQNALSGWIEPHPRFLLLEKHIPIVDVLNNVYYGVWSSYSLKWFSTDYIEDAKLLDNENSLHTYVNQVVSRDRNSDDQWTVDKCDAIILHLAKQCILKYRVLDPSTYFNELQEAARRTTLDNRYPVQVITGQTKDVPSQHYIRGIVLHLTYHKLVFLID
jgi:hypothetical protein